ncbi:MAG: YsnF/AvaK domain-containing protein [Rhodopila sp.]
MPPDPPIRPRVQWGTAQHACGDAAPGLALKSARRRATSLAVRHKPLRHARQAHAVNGLFRCDCADVSFSKLDAAIQVKRTSLAAVQSLGRPVKGSTRKTGPALNATACSYVSFALGKGSGDMAAEPKRVEEAVIPIAEESVSLVKHEVETSRVRVALNTEVQAVVVRETLRGNHIEVERVPVNRLLPEDEPPPQSRREGDTLIIPVLEERPVVVKRLVVTEEVRLRFVSTVTPFEEEVSVRRQEATVDRVQPDATKRVQQ